MARPPPGLGSVPLAAVPVRELRRIAGALLTSLVAAFAVLVAASLWSAPVAAQGSASLTIATTATYRVVPEASRVEVEFGYTFENLTDTASFPAFFESIPATALDVAATDGSSGLLGAPTAQTDGFDTWLFAFSSPLDPGDSASVVISWAIAGGTSSQGPIIEPGAAAFDVYAPAPDGATWTPAVIEAPEGYVVLAGEEATAPYEITAARLVNLGGYRTTLAALPPDVGVTDWDDGGDWTGSVVDRATAVVTSLESWFGVREAPFEIRRSFPGDQHLGFEASMVELADDSAASVDHQLAHVWLSDVTVEADWFIEGLAAAFAGDDPQPSDAADFVPAIADEIGAVGVRAVVDALRAQTITYPGVVDEPQPLPPDWRTVLDHLEGVGGADELDPQFWAAVAQGDDAAMLDRRASARLDYEALEFRSGGWTLPPYLRLAMAGWDFETFNAEQGAVSDAIVRRDSLLSWAESLELAPRDDGKELFEAAEDGMVEVDELLDEQEAALAAFDEAERLVNGDRGLLARVGLLGHDADGELAELRAAWDDGDYARVEHDGEDLSSLVEGAVGAGTIRLLVPALGLLAAWQLLRWVRRRFAVVQDVANSDA